MPNVNCSTGEVTYSEEEIAAINKPSVPSSITRRQCALQLFSMKTITLQEALDMTKTAAVPAAIAAIFAQMPEEARLLAEIDFAAANYYRANQLLGMMGLTSPQIDDFFIAAAAR